MLFYDKNKSKETFLISLWPHNDSLQGSSSASTLEAQINTEYSFDFNRNISSINTYNPFLYSQEGDYPQLASSTKVLKYLGPSFWSRYRDVFENNTRQQGLSGSYLNYSPQNSLSSFFNFNQGLYVMKVSLKLIELLSERESTHYPFDLIMQSYVMSLVTLINYKDLIFQMKKP